MSTSAPVQDLSYPIGKFYYETAMTAAQRKAAIDAIAQTPAKLRESVRGLSPQQLDTPYRPGGWTVRQVVHHVPDSHMNAYIRMKLAATEETPSIRTYEEQLWAELPDGKSAPPELSLVLLESLHRRWMVFLRNLSDAQFQRPFMHPEWQRVTIDEAVALYAWHCRHHTAHIEQALGARTA